MDPQLFSRFAYVPKSVGTVALCLLTLLMFWAPTQAQVTYTFSNTQAEAHNTWDSGNNWNTALVKPLAVSAVPTSAMVLRQVNLDLGSASGSNIATLTGRLTDPAGNTVTLFAPGYFFSTDFSRFVNIKFRDHPTLKRLSDFTNSYLGMPYSFGYYRVEAANSYQNFNTTDQVNGTWTFEMIENTGVEIQFNQVELVFGPPFNYIDITGGTDNNQCAQAQCVQSGAGEVLLATNINYPQSQPNYPNLTVNGCNWNAEPNNTAWFRFIASATSVDLSVSGFTNSPQQTIVLQNTGTCSAPAYSMVGCPWSMFVGGCNTTTGNPTLYHRVCYDGGTKFNHGYSLSGLTVGAEYVLVVDGQAGANSTFYIEITTGADNGCSLAPEEPEITNVVLEDPDCSGGNGSITVVATGLEPLSYSIDGGTTFQSDPVFTGLGAGTYAVVVQDVDGATASTSVVLVAPEVPEIDAVTTTDPTCNEANGSITIDASSNEVLSYSIDGGTTFQTSNTFTDLPAGSYAIVVESDGCTATSTVDLVAADAPVLVNVEVQGPTCFGDADGTIVITATGAEPLSYSIDGGTSFQPGGSFAGLVAGTYAIVVEDATGCPVQSTVVLEEPELVAILSVEVLPETCAGACDGSLLLVANGATSYSLNDGTTQSDPAFNDLCPGSYTVVASNANGCTASDTLVVLPGTFVQAGFTAEPEVVLVPGTPVEFTNTSQGAVSYSWDFGGLGTSEDESPEFVFPLEEGTVQVCLTATSADGCEDTACTELRIGSSSDVDVPTVFTPNGDGVNDTFGIIGDPGAVRSFSLQVFNRWGQLLFSGERKFQVWDGRQGSGEIVPDGTYFWVLDYTPEVGENVVRTGHVTLLR